MEKEPDFLLSNHSAAHEILELLKTVFVTAFVTWLLFGYIFGLCFVSGSSMLPSRHNGDLSIVLRPPHYSSEHISRNDVITFRPYENNNRLLYIKRVIALPGDHVVINYEEKTVSVNDEVLNEPYILEEMEAIYEDMDLIVPDGCIFVLGDNRNNSHDSRADDVGCVSIDRIFGKEILLLKLSEFF